MIGPFFTVTSPISSVSPWICFASDSERAHVPGPSAGHGVKPSMPSSFSRAGSMPTMTANRPSLRGRTPISRGERPRRCALDAVRFSIFDASNVSGRNQSEPSRRMTMSALPAWSETRSTYETATDSRPTWTAVRSARVQKTPRMPMAARVLRREKLRRT
jgi:hypothetical protein